MIYNRHSGVRRLVLLGLLQLMRGRRHHRMLLLEVVADHRVRPGRQSVHRGNRRGIGVLAAEVGLIGNLLADG